MSKKTQKLLIYGGLAVAVGLLFTTGIPLGGGQFLTLNGAAQTTTPS